MAFLVSDIIGFVYADIHGISIRTETPPVSVEENHPPLKKQKLIVERMSSKY